MKKTLISIAIILSFFFGCSQQQTKDYKLFLLSEGQQMANPSILINVPDSVMQQFTEFPNAVNAFLLKSKSGKNILIDAGFGKKLFSNLQSLQVSHVQVDYILLTHLHGDHIGGMIVDGEVSFPNAQVYLSQKEYDYWINGNNENAKLMLEKYKDKIHLFNSQDIDCTNYTTIIEELPEIKAISAYGHTPGHTMYLCTSPDTLLIWGDLTHAMTIQMPYPEVSVTYDVDPDQARETRLKVLNKISGKNITVAGMHIAYPSIGKVIKDDTMGYKFIY